MKFIKKYYWQLEASILTTPIPEGVAVKPGSKFISDDENTACTVPLSV